MFVPAAVALPAPQIRFCKSRDGTCIAYETCSAGPPLGWEARWLHHLKTDWDDPVWRPLLAVLTPTLSSATICAGPGCLISRIPKIYFRGRSNGSCKDPG